jgi:hypothetical protein
MYNGVNLRVLVTLSLKNSGARMVRDNLLWSGGVSQGSDWMTQTSASGSARGELPQLGQKDFVCHGFSTIIASKPSFCSKQIRVRYPKCGIL